MTNTKKRALGRGLSALLESNENTGAAISRPVPNAGGIYHIMLNRIAVNPFQPRSLFNAEALQSLAESIRQHGLIQPITVRKVSPDEYQLISGERRLKAMQMAGLTEAPAYVRVANDQSMLEMALIENTHRSDLDPIEVAMGYSRLIEECGLTQENLSERVALDRATISNYLRLLKLPPVIQLALREKKLTMGHAKALLGIDNPAVQLTMFDKILDESISVRETEKIAKQNKKSSRKKTGGSATSQADSNLEKEIAEHLGSGVKLSRTGNGKGKLVISFYSDDQLQTIIERINLRSL
ncbi:MAG: ParB/RepB/Spo0J family partition protein [Bacteroidia bacterium]|jgi:ParB family chromosome partitioning protein|nr:ParB/RepB/Spo0J family partition protein [Bacteroidia bacterium]